MLCHGKVIMLTVKRVLMVGGIRHGPTAMFLNQQLKLGKGFIRLGYDVRYFHYRNVLMELSPFRSRTLKRYLYKDKADDLLATEVENYKPDIIFVGFVRVLDATTVEKMRQAAPEAVFIGHDGDPWPQLHPGRIDIAKKLDILMGTNDGQFLQDYRDAGVSKCVFMPNFCDPDIDHRYDVGPEWKANILWTGLIRHNPKRYPGEDLRSELVNRIAGMPNCAVYGCCGRPNIGGSDYLYAISGTRIGLSINGDNNVRLYHSDRLTHYLACGTFVLAKRVPDSDLLFKDGVHLRYFDTADEFFELAQWFLEHNAERRKISDAGMRRAHTEFNCEKIAKYIMDLIENGAYIASWTD